MSTKIDDFERQADTGALRSAVQGIDRALGPGAGKMLVSLLDMAHLGGIGQALAVAEGCERPEDIIPRLRLFYIGAENDPISKRAAGEGDT